MSDSTLLDLARQYMESGRMEDARRLLTGLCINNPGDADAWHLLSAVYGQLRLFDDAATCARRTMELRPAFQGAYVNLGIALQAAGNTALSVAPLLQAVQMFPNDTELGILYATALEGTGRTNEAIAQLRSVCAANAHNATLLCNVGHSLVRIGAFEDAAIAYQRAATVDEKNVQALCGLGYVSRFKGNHADAVQFYRRALILQPGYAEARSGIAAALERSGDFDGALHALEPALSDFTPDIHALVIFARICRRYGRQAEAIQLLTQALERPNVPRDMELEARFALGRLHDDQGAYEEAFENYQFANQLKQTTFDPIQHRRGVDRLIRAFSASFMQGAPRASNTSEVPIFIVGMPRSGTSLVEQILVSHPAVSGAGELQAMPLLVTELERLAGPLAPYPESIRDVRGQTLQVLADRYLSVLRSLSPDAARVTDKLPGNWWNLGLIELLFPRARIVHVERDARDACLSCYFQNFAVGHNYAFNLAHVGSFFRDYSAAMRHWQSVLRVPTLSVRYEDLVTDLEAQSRRLVAFCGLDWDPRCALPHKTERTVNTASYYQVRRPVYTSSIGRWKHYDRHLRPLMDVLERLP